LVAASSVLTAHASTVAEKRRQRGPKTAHGSRQEGIGTPLHPIIAEPVRRFH
jgi:hypothetical protein